MARELTWPKSDRKPGGHCETESRGKFASFWPITNSPGDEGSFPVRIDELSRDTTILHSFLRSMRRCLDTLLTNGGGYAKY